MRVCCRSGKGGDGFVHFHRDRFTAKGGPDGGDGGRGGHVILKGSRHHWTLLHLRYHKHVIAEPGQPGGSSNKKGADGKDVILEVPLGTVVKDAETEKQECEITEDGETVILVSGGKGGKGNTRFKHAEQQAPRYAQDGQSGREEWKVLELKLLADVGLVGFPNAGKSTLLSVVSAARPEIADYPFTTMKPNLGMVSYRDHHSFVMADIPGIIEGAHEGKGLGTRFLRHIERNALLLFMVPADSNDHRKEYEVLLHELEAYDPQLLDKERLLGISKADLLDDELKEAIEKELPEDVVYLFFSSATGEGIDHLKDCIWERLEKEPA